MPAEFIGKESGDDVAQNQHTHCDGEHGAFAGLHPAQAVVIVHGGFQRLILLDQEGLFRIGILVISPEPLLQKPDTVFIKLGEPVFRYGFRDIIVVIPEAGSEGKVH